MYSVETDARLAALRAIRQTRDLTDEEQKEAIRLVREGRVSASHASTTSRTKTAAKAPVDGNALLEKIQASIAKVQADKAKEG